MPVKLKMHAKNKAHIEATIIHNDTPVGWIESEKNRDSFIYKVFIHSNNLLETNEWADAWNFIKLYCVE